MKKLRYPLDIQLFAEGDPDVKSEVEIGVEEEVKEPEKGEKTVSKKLYDQKVKELSSANKKLKEYEGKDNDIAAKEQRISELEAELNTQKVDSQLMSKLITMGCTDVDYALFKIHQANPDLKPGDDGKIANLDELTTSVKTSNPTVFKGEDEKEVEVGKLGGEPSGGETMTKESFLKKPYGERAAFAQEHPEEFSKLMKG